MSTRPICIECRRGFHDVCHPGEPCPCSETPVDHSPEPVEEDKPSQKVNPNYDTEDPEAEWRVSSGGARRGKRDAALKDQQSTGRKRAARLFPLDREAPCEWRGRPLAGGGMYPIKGCDSGLQRQRHHGPEKSTLNNEEGNVWRICDDCHARWHTLNDPTYNPLQVVRFEIQDAMEREGKTGYVTEAQKKRFAD